MHVALLQTAVCADETTNMRTAASCIRGAAQQGADIAVLPEMFCCPYDPRVFAQYAQPQGGKRWQQLSALARAHNLYLVAGSVPECEGEHLYNTSFVFAPDGAQIARHRKAHLFDVAFEGKPAFRESDSFCPGHGITTFDTPFCRCGLMICYDIRFPEYALETAEAGADVIFVPACFNQRTGPAHWELLFRARAADNQVFMAGVSSALDWQATYHSYAHSIAVSPWGDVLAQLGTRPENHIVSFDLSRLAAVRQQMPLASHRKAYQNHTS